MNVFRDNSQQIRRFVDSAKQKTLLKIGERWQTVVRKTITDMEAVDTGNLRDSMGFHSNANILTLGSTADYAVHVNYGTSKTKPRPFMEHSILESLDEFEKIAALCIITPALNV